MWTVRRNGIACVALFYACVLTGRCSGTRMFASALFWKVKGEGVNYMSLLGETRIVQRSEAPDARGQKQQDKPSCSHCKLMYTS